MALGYWIIATMTQTQSRQRILPNSEPSLLECLAMLATAFAIQIFEYWRHGGFWYRVGDFEDNQVYAAAAQFIRLGHYGAYPDWHFMGFPSVIAALSSMLPIRELPALVGISWAASIALCILVHRMYGGTVAIMFWIVSLEWLHLSVLGSSEPLFTLLFLSSMAAARTERWHLSCLLASVATLVRPPGIFALIALGAVMLSRKNWVTLLGAISMSVGIGLAYLGFVHRLAGDTFMNFRAYRSEWRDSLPITLPFLRLPSGCLQMIQGLHWTSLLESFLFIALTIACGFAVYLNRRGLFKSYLVERTAAVLYLLFFASYNFPLIAWYWPRFLAPIMPTLIFSISDLLPTSRWITWPLAVLSALLSAAYIVRFEPVFGFTLHR